MRQLTRAFGLVTAASIGVAALCPGEASACGGGWFVEEVSQGETVGATGHRVVISMSQAQTVLWDQIQYKGDPAGFAWVYPVKTGARVEAATDAWLEALDAVSQKRLQSPTVECATMDGEPMASGCGCYGAGSDRGGFDQVGGDQSTDVTVVHRGTTGPYDTVTVKSEVPGAIGQWLMDNGYSVPAAVTPVLDDYAAQGFDFIALRLSPDKGVDEMTPVRVVTPGAQTSFPLKMLSAGAGDTVALEVLVLTEGRVGVTGSFTTSEIASDALIWDFDKQTSNYADLRTAALQKNGGATFVTTYALQGPLFGREDLGEGEEDPRAARLYFDAAQKNGEAATCTYGVIDALYSVSGSTSMGAQGYKVVDTCDAQGNCTLPGVNEIDARDLLCDKADDLAVAMIGMHPEDVWLTRLEANLPKGTLTADLNLTPVVDPVPLHGYVQIQNSLGDACAVGLPAVNKDDSKPATPRPPAPPLSMGALAMLGVALTVLTATLRRKLAVTGTSRAA
ncbi:MAG: DUF2330 domain-containing protein [Polyangiaceae bacterium]